MEAGARGSRYEISSPGAILAILALINFINYVDRQVMGPLVPLLKAPLAEGGLGLSGTQVGLLGSAFMVVHSLASIPLGMVADRFLRKRLIAIGVGVWSVATGLAGLATSYWQLFLARASVGIGEATYAPAASAMISEKFQPHQRARALGVFQVGMMLGGAGAVLLGGLIGEHFGWRAAFFVVGLPGLVLTVLVMRIAEVPPSARAKLEGSPDAHGHGGLSTASLRVDTRAMSRSPAVVWIVVAGVFISFFVGALVFWAPAFILEYHYGNDKSAIGDASAIFAGVAATGALLGTLFGSWLADRLERTRPGEGRLLTIAIGVITSAPLALIGLHAEGRLLLFGAIGLGIFFNSWYVGPVLAALHDVVSPRVRGTATGVYFLAIHLLGDAFSPAVVGAVGDATGSLRTGLTVAIGALFLGGVAALMAIPHSRKLAKLKAESTPG